VTKRSRPGQPEPESRPEPVFEASHSGGYGSQVQNFSSRLFDSVKGHGRAWKLHLEALISQSHNLSSSSATHHVPVIDSGFNVQHAIHTLQPVRTDTQVLLVGLLIIMSLSAGWAGYWFQTQHGREMGDLRMVLLGVSFAATSWGMNVVNKSLVETLRAPALVTGAQMSMTVISSVVLTRSRFRGSREEVMHWAPVPLIFFGMLLSSFLTYKYLTLSMLMIVRNLGPLVVLPIEMLGMPADKRPCVTVPMLLALLVLLSGAVIYCTTIEVSLRGLIFASLNLFFAITDRMAQRRLLTNECRGLSTESCMFLNNVFGLIPTLLMGMYFGELKDFDWHLWFASSTGALLLLSGVIGSGICYFAIALQREIAGTSFMVLQNVIRMAVAGVGVIVFHDPIGWPFQIVGLALSFLGALWYGKSLIDGKEQKLALSKKQVSATLPSKWDKSELSKAGHLAEICCNGG